MAQAKIKKDIKIYLELNAAEALFLKALTQNGQVDESNKELQLRSDIFEALKSVADQENLEKR